ncbi:sugar ABC transporter ATP-binding protein [Leucobacter allii]|uniref:Sugar ABC transporter ATP-binding protein n=1 Tax=Leucobacter allii TaxID=2932247 RepID=A0ABY4FJ40_9MICO|nr:sugar ABC transporter ATP-binding protein [Leucobacter allii]UOQ55937.1 sugar ABC transporter ATP-binding protein [Leucobacter allii]
MREEPFISIRGLRKSFGRVTVLHDVDLDLAAGEVTALLGENGAGKSTLVKILTGSYRSDAGRITIGGEDATNAGIATTRRYGVRTISQELSDAPALSVSENISLGSWPMRGPFVDRRAMDRTARRVLAELGSDLDPARAAGTLRLGERQLLEIARATAGDMRAVILDEPTAALSDAEARVLFAVIAQLTARGVAVIYITHRLDEVFAIADRTLVLRDGRVALHARTAETNAEEVIAAMVGRKVEQVRYPPGSDARERPGGLTVSGLDAEGFSDVSFTAERGRVVGIYGKVGSGVVELAEALFGARPVRAGRIEKDGVRLRLSGPAAAIRAGIGFLPADRKGDALLPTRGVAENLAAPSWRRLARFGFLSRRVESAAYQRWHEPLGIRSQGEPEQRITTLSGGNQQKVLLGRWLEQGSDVLVLTEPTRGVDVGARQEIYQALRRLADDGAVVIVATSDYEDMIAIADEAHILIRGRQVAHIPGADISVASLTHAAGGAIHV